MINLKKLWLLVISMLLITGCNGTTLPGEEENKDNNQGNDQNQEVVEKINIYDLESDSRPYAVVINNYPAAVKAQTGLNEAYIVYEFPIEGGLTRSLALFKDVTNVKLGTVRSARKDYIDYVLENDAIFVHFGWEQHVAKSDILNLKINYIDGDTRDGKVFKRENPFNLAWEHRVYTNLSTVIDYAKNTMKYRTTTEVEPVLNYTNLNVDLSKYEDSKKADTVELSYSGSFKVKFVYNSETTRYDRYVNGNLHKDYVSGETFDTENIIITLLDWGKLPYTDAAGNNYLDLKNEGTGKGYYITNGYAKEITWTKDTRSSQTVYKYLDGTEIDVNDGNTYVMFQSNTKGVSIN